MLLVVFCCFILSAAPIDTVTECCVFVCKCRLQRIERFEAYNKIEYAIICMLFAKQLCVQLMPKARSEITTTKFASPPNV
ncbi:uncharacterized protein BYT42DRAFT_579441, partial [Radiomyces spectabilis]|uniref:uncharacterized protein n=1 Tax=Radiomyces spectabilis TaxID=64574 RepID=UPI00221EE028